MPFQMVSVAKLFMTAQPHPTPESCTGNKAHQSIDWGKCFSLSSGPMSVRRVGRPQLQLTSGTQKNPHGRGALVTQVCGATPGTRSEDTKMHAGDGVALTVLGSPLPATHSRVT